MNGWKERERERERSVCVCVWWKDYVDLLNRNWGLLLRIVFRGLCFVNYLLVTGFSLDFYGIPGWGCCVRVKRRVK